MERRRITRMRGGDEEGSRGKGEHLVQSLIPNRGAEAGDL